MKAELAIVRDSVIPAPKEPTTASRKALREKTDDLIHGALLVNDLPELVRLSAETMIAVASILAQYEQDPQVPDLVEAVQASIETGRAVMDRGLLLGDWPTVNCGAVMLELTVRGLCAALGVPYDKVLAEVHRAQQAGQNADVRVILVQAAVIREAAPEVMHQPV